MAEDVDQVRQAIRRLEQSIGRAFVADGLYVHLGGAVQGPHSLLFRVRLYEPTAGNLRKALGLGGAIEAATGLTPARVTSDAGVLHIELPSPWPCMIPGAGLRGQRLAVPLGMTPRRAIVGVDFAETAHMLLVGPTGKGKTTAMRLIAYHLARQNHAGRIALVMLTLKPDDWRAFAALGATWAVIADPREASDAGAWLHAEMQARTRRGARLPELFVFCDDLANLLPVSSIGATLPDLASMGRAAGIHLIIGTQRTGNRGSGDALIAANIGTRLVFGTVSAADAALYTGRGGSGAEALGSYPGDALLVTDGGAQRLAVGYVGDDALQTLPQGAYELRPWQTTTTTTGAQTALERITDAPDATTTTTDRGARIRALYAQLQSKSAVCFEIWGYKDTRTLRIVDAALEAQ